MHVRSCMRGLCLRARARVAGRARAAIPCQRRSSPSLHPPDEPPCHPTAPPPRTAFWCRTCCGGRASLVRGLTRQPSTWALPPTCWTAGSARPPAPSPPLCVRRWRRTGEGAWGVGAHRERGGERGEGPRVPEARQRQRLRPPDAHAPRPHTLPCAQAVHRGPLPGALCGLAHQCLRAVQPQAAQGLAGAAGARAVWRVGGRGTLAPARQPCRDGCLAHPSIATVPVPPPLPPWHPCARAGQRHRPGRAVRGAADGLQGHVALHALLHGCAAAAQHPPPTPPACAPACHCTRASLRAQHSRFPPATPRRGHVPKPEASAARGCSRVHPLLRHAAGETRERSSSLCGRGRCTPSLGGGRVHSSPAALRLPPPPLSS